MRALDTLSRWTRTFLLGATLLTGATGCMGYDDLDQEVVLETHVDDWRDQVIYQVMIDRFEDGDVGLNFNVDTTALARWHGGDWVGLESRLDYVKELGVTAIWISPAYKNVETDAAVDGYHGYWPQDFTQPNTHFGDLKALRSLVRAAHERDILIILDVVTNHVGQLFYYDINLNGNPDQQVRGSGEQSEVVNINEFDPDFDPRGIQSETSLGEAGPAPIIFLNDPAINRVPPMPPVLQNPAAYNRRGRTVSFDDPDQLVRGDFPGGLKDIDTTRCDVKEAMVEAYVRWVEWTDLDGFRIDTVKHVDAEFWRYFTQKVRQRLAAKGKNKFFMFGESFDGNPALVGSFTKHDAPPAEVLERENACVTDGLQITGDQLDSTFHFPQYYTVMRDVFQLGQSTDRIQALWEAVPDNYGTTAPELGAGLPATKSLVNFIDNHDVPRFLFQSDQPALHLALLFVMTESGIPCIYYGTEQGFSGGNDPANREDMWLSGFNTGHPTFQWVQRLNALRKGYLALRRGDQRVTWASSRTGAEEDAGIFAFERSGGDAGDQYALVVLNTSRNQASSTSFEGAAMAVSATGELVDVLSGERFTVAGDGTLAITVEPLGGRLLVPASQVVPGL